MNPDISTIPADCFDFLLLLFPKLIATILLRVTRSARYPEEKSMAEMKKPAGQQNKRPRLSQNAESSGKKSSILAVTSPAATKAPALATPSPVAAKTPALAAPSPVATKTPAPAGPCPAAMKAPVLSAPSPVATKTPAPAGPCPAAMKTPVLSAPSPVAMARPIAVVKPTAAVKPSAEVTHEQGDGGVPEERDQQAGADAMAMVAVAEERVNVDLEKKWLHCAVCPAPLKPPIFKCEGGHAVCCTCAGAGAGEDIPKKHCSACNRAVSYTRDSHTEGLVGACKVPCPYKKFGCTSKSVAYHETGEHKAACACAPCYCWECPFEGSPARLLRHLTEESGRHSWRAETINYDTPHAFIVPGGSSEYRRLLVAEEDSSVFLLAAGAAGRGVAGVRPVTVVCVRGNTADDARPRYRGVLWVDAPGPGDDRECLKLKRTVASCAVPGAVEMEHGQLHAHVNPEMLHGESKEVHLHISIMKLP